MTIIIIVTIALLSYSFIANVVERSFGATNGNYDETPQPNTAECSLQRRMKIIVEGDEGPPIEHNEEVIDLCTTKLRRIRFI